MTSILYTVDERRMHFASTKVRGLLNDTEELAYYKFPSDIPSWQMY